MQEERRSEEMVHNVPYKVFGPKNYPFMRLLSLFQGGACAVCGNEEGPRYPSGNFLVLDHDHRRLQSRGLLCGKCNSKLTFAEGTGFDFYDSRHQVTPDQWGEDLGRKIRSYLSDPPARALLNKIVQEEKCQNRNWVYNPRDLKELVRLWEAKQIGRLALRESDIKNLTRDCREDFLKLERRLREAGK
jgi:hypothetical protein